MARTGTLAFDLKSAVKRTSACFGIEWRRVRSVHEIRPVGNMHAFLEDLRGRGLECRWILDVGANRGDWSTLALTQFTGAKVLMIEPQEEMRSHLDRVCAAHAGSRWVMAGAGAEPGELTLTVWQDLAGSSFLPPESASMRTGGQQRTVPIVTIDALLEEHGIDPPELVKLDVQGFELEALKGASSLFGRTEVFIMEASLFEFLPGQPTLYEMMTFMGDRGYELYDFAGFARRPSDGALGQADACFVQAEGRFRRSNTW